MSIIKKLIAKGIPTSTGIAKGKVLVVFDPYKFDNVEFLSSGNFILVTTYTNPDFEMIMFKCSGFISEKGGVTCHMSIVARELNKPAVVAVEGATKIFKENSELEINGYTGEIFEIKTER